MKTQLKGWTVYYLQARGSSREEWWDCVGIGGTKAEAMPRFVGAKKAQPKTQFRLIKCTVKREVVG